MSLITQIKLQKNNRIANIFTDNRFAVSLDLVTIKKHGLKVGLHISNNDLYSLIKQSSFEKFMNLAYYYLSFRPRSEKELRQYLFNKAKIKIIINITDTIEKVIDKLKKQKMIDDQEFADWWIEQRMHFRPKGKILLTKELKIKGINQEIINDLLSRIDEISAARKALQKKQKKLHSKSEKSDKQRITNFLISRGFTWETIKSVVDESFLKK